MGKSLSVTQHHIVLLYKPYEIKFSSKMIPYVPLLDTLDFIYLGKFIFFASLTKSIFEIETMHISKSDQTKLSKTVSCFSSFQMEELRIGLQEDIAKMHTVLAYPKVKVYLVKVIGHPPFFYYSECFMIAAALRDSSGPTRLKYQRKKYSSISTKSKAHGQSSYKKIWKEAKKFWCITFFEVF